MATSDQHSPSAVEERLQLSRQSGSLLSGAQIVGAIGIIAALFLGWAFGDHSFRRFYFAYLVSFAFVLSLALGGLFFVLLQHVTKAGWSVSVRRIAEWLASSMPVVAVLAVPIAVPVLLHRGELYPWSGPRPAPEAATVAPATPAGPAAQLSAEGAKSEADTRFETARNPEALKAPEAAQGAGEGGDEEMTGFKRFYLNPFFWLIRLAFYFFIWSSIGIWYWRQSLRQDATGDLAITSEMQRRSPVSMIAFGLTLTLASFDLLMSLDPSWSSTIFGVYYFAGCVIGCIATLIISVLLLQRAGYLRRSVTIEHFHDLGKLLFGFTFFWGYIAFSQFMLMWYANLPEETRWFLRHGATTSHVPGTTQTTVNGWSYVIVAILFGHLLIPFAGLLSRHVKRNPAVLCFWAIWMLTFHWIDLFWVVMPQYNGEHIVFGLVEIAALIGVGGIFLWAVLSRAVQGAVRPTHDPRLSAALEFQNV